MKKLILIVSSICLIIVGIFIIYASIMDKNIPKPIWLVFTICAFVSAINNLFNYHKLKKNNSDS